MAVNFIRYDPVLFLYRPRMLDTLELHRNKFNKNSNDDKKNNEYCDGNCFCWSSLKYRKIVENVEGEYQETGLGKRCKREAQQSKQTNNHKNDAAYTRGTVIPILSKIGFCCRFVLSCSSSHAHMILFLTCIRIFSVVFCLHFENICLQT